MVNHIGTWKYRLRIVSLMMNCLGTGIKKPPITVYARKIIQTTFHHDRRINISESIFAKVIV